MDAFHWIVVPISTVLGLAIARILTAYVHAFKARGRLRFDWLPLAVAGAVLGEGLQFWWALLELSVLKSWSLAAFTLLIGMVMTLFTAAALIVPAESDHDMRAAFERDGRWALLALAGFHLSAILANAWLWHAPLLSTTQMLIAVLVVLCVVGSVTRRRRWQEGALALYLLLTVIDTFVASLAAY
ncbi:hypothetical protein [Ancylobacter defluvii]|uniref:Uncharacterized protein n=1 Tax=Ancylobacter defluvii TaxID=1282440 RepID=A0A9W6JS19_9HYPH|nr:hypothetical protein [Ancylobacter defluvii]MBS7587511.1 hypothetical protein [Ancylobacter defluvii]GLK82202.1 hypothetical protein GCM10017653_02710 [Ancylobacter defluvii]